MPIADSSAPIVVGIRQIEKRHQDDDRLLGVRVDRERLQGDDRQEQDDREAGEQDVERDLVRCLLAARTFDQRDHPVEEALAGLRGDPNDDLVGEHPRPTCHGGAVAAGLADHRSRLAGDRRLVDRRDPLDHVAVGGDDLAGRDDDLVADRELQRSEAPR